MKFRMKNGLCVRVRVCVSVYDAFGKMGSDVKGGNENQPGSVQQCRSVCAPTFSGRYCKVSLKQVIAGKSITHKPDARCDPALFHTPAGTGGVL